MVRLEQDCVGFFVVELSDVLRARAAKRCLGLESRISKN